MTAPELLRADCARCVGLCCVALAFSRSADFAVDKEAGEPCRNLAADHRCTIHARLRESGFPGCTVYDCLGAGQRVTQVVMAGRSWRDDPTTASTMFAVFGVVRGLHELLWYLTEVLGRPDAAEAHADARVLHDRVERLAQATPDDVLAADGGALQAEVAGVLRRASAAVRGPGAPDLAGASLVGVDRRGADLRRAGLRGALLVGADLRGADLRDADLLGADLRGADLRGADLTGALFCTPMQIAAARGDATTRLPAGLVAPDAWDAAPSATSPAPGLRAVAAVSPRPRRGARGRRGGPSRPAARGR